MFRNKEIRQFAGAFLTLAALSVLIGFRLDKAAGILCLISAALFGMLFFAFTHARYQHLAELSQQIDLVLHNADRLTIDTVEAVSYTHLGRLPSGAHGCRLRPGGAAV